MDTPESARRLPLRLADHVRACGLGQQVVLLDLRRSQYLAVSRSRWHRLTGDPEAPSGAQLAPRCTLSDDCSDQLVAPLVLRGLLTRLPPRQNAGTVLARAESSWDDSRAIHGTAVGAARVCRVLHAAAWTATMLRLRSLQHIAEHVARRTARLHGPRAEEAPGLDGAVAAFHELRPLLFTARDRCLNDSIALVTFLAAEGVAARWVIGVRAGPFAAHSWVQSGGMVLNDLHENVRQYEPILVV